MRCACSMRTGLDASASPASFGCPLAFNRLVERAAHCCVPGAGRGIQSTSSVSGMCSMCLELRPLAPRHPTLDCRAWSVALALPLLVICLAMTERGLQVTRWA